MPDNSVSKPDRHRCAARTRAGWLPTGLSLTSAAVNLGKPEGALALTGGAKAITLELTTGPLNATSLVGNSIATKPFGSYTMTVFGTGYDQATVQRVLDSLDFSRLNSSPSTWWTFEPGRQPLTESSVVIELPELLVADAAQWRAWLHEHADSAGVWLVLGKKGGQVTAWSTTGAGRGAVLGWIDGQVKRRDEGSLRQRFTPRRPRAPGRRATSASPSG